MSNKQSYKKNGKYNSDWSIQLTDPGLSDCSFSFDGNKYSLLPYHKKLSPAQLDNIYLDVNRSWTKEEYNRILDLAEGRNVFVYLNEIVKIDASNKQDLWEGLKKQQFSLFPFYEIANPDLSVIITKSNQYSPNIDDLQASVFMQKTKLFLGKSHKIKLFNLDNTLSPYLKSLKELRVFQYDSGDLDMLQRVFQKNHFADDLENDDRIIIHRSDMIINKSVEDAESSGPDHLMRLFSYNHIMQKLGRDMLTDRPIGDSLVQEARKAYVVSPVSSLVVLETQQDYDRFNINDADNSLKNASMKSKGAVPEPHEWVLIILVALVLVVVMRKRRTQFSA